MFDIGFSELVVVGLIALIVLGPKRLPEVARAAGRWTGKLRRFIDNTKREIDREIKDEDLAALKDVHREIIETRDFLGKSASDALSPGLSDPFADTPSIAAAGSSATPPASPPKVSIKHNKTRRAKKSKPLTKNRARKRTRRKPHGRR